MMNPRWFRRALMLAVLLCLVSAASSGLSAADDAEPVRRYLYVAQPGIRNYLEYGGHGVLVYDIDDGHRFVRRIPSAGLNEQGEPINVKGVCANAQTKRLYVSTIRSLICFELRTDEILWERDYEGGCDRMSMTPDGRVIYLPSFEKAHWHVVDALSGEVLAKIVPDSGAHNTVVALDGREAYLAGLRSPLLTVADARQHEAVRTVGPFGNNIRPFTVNGSRTLCFVNVNELLGFEVGDLKTGKRLHRVEVEGFEKGPVKRHGCPSHGIGLTPDERELWVCDATNRRMHVFDATVLPPKQAASIEVRDEPGWITFSLDGRLAYPSTGDIIDVKSRRVVAQLTDEEGRMVMSEKMVEIHFKGEEPVRAGDQFGLGRVQPR
jgi:DNA-binding beta-propeller fold protein YncE